MPSTGTTYHYEGTDGSTVSATVLGKAERSDAGGNVIPSWIFEYQLTFARFAEPLIVQEAIDLRTGSHVRHDVVCRPATTHSEAPCEPVSEVFYAAAGFAGALGVAPFWGSMITEESKLDDGPGVFFAQNVALSLEPHHGSDAKCLTFAPYPESGTSVGASWMPVMAGHAQRVACNGMFLPSQWSPDRPVPAFFSDVPFPSYSLVRISDRASVVTLSPSSPVGREDSPQIRGGQSLLTHEPTVTNFSSLRAHEYAIANDPEYAATANAPNALVVEAQYTSGGRWVGPLGIEQEEYAHWTLTVAASRDEAHETTVLQTRARDVSGRMSVNYSVTESSPTTWPTDQRPAGDLFSGAEAGAAYRLGSKLFERDPDGAHHVFKTKTSVGGARDTFLTDRFISRTFYLPADAEDAGIVTPWVIEFDSWSGLLRYAAIPPDVAARI